jgi:hypothetical protein
LTYNKIPKAQNIPVLNINVEGLRRYSILGIFRSEPSLSVDEGRLREWLRHTLYTAAKHYCEARSLVERQESVDQKRDGGLVLYVFDIPEHVEGCVMALFRVCAALRRMSVHSASAAEFCSLFEGTIRELRAIRNQFEHMENQVVNGESGSGPIVVSFCEEGMVVKFRSLVMPTASLHMLLEGVFKVVAALYPGFDARSGSVGIGVPKLQLSMTIKTKERDPEKQGAE